MKDAYAVLLQKERDILRVRQEIEALRFIIPLLSEDPGPSPPAIAVPTVALQQKNRWPLEVQ